MDNRFYLQALGITGLFIGLMFLVWIVSGGPASEAAVNNANNTRTAIAMTGSYLLQPRSSTPDPSIPTPTSVLQTSAPGSSSTLSAAPTVTSTSLLQFNTPLPPSEPSVTPRPSLTPFVEVPVFTTTPPNGRIVTKSAPLASEPTGIPTLGIPVTGQTQDPADFARWYFTRVWNERDYQNLWDNYLTISYKTNVGSGLFEDYVGWWNSVTRVDVVSADVISNNGTDAWVRVNLTFHMADGRVIDNQVYEYDFLYDPTRKTWMFDASG